MLIFGSLSKLDLTDANWIFWLGIRLTKCIIFIAVFVVHAFPNWGKPIGLSTLRGTFGTNCNHFFLGLPILNALFQKSHPK